ncbi:MAG: SDR family NAD(P)-dependent oxidoreductase [Methylococcus sp.]
MRRTLRNVKALLKEGGIAVINEISDKTVFATVLFGLIDGWSLAEDLHWRIPGSPGLFPEAWRTLLGQEGFVEVEFPAAAAHGLGQQVIVATSNGLILRPPAPAGSPVEPLSPAVEPERVAAGRATPAEAEAASSLLREVEARVGECLARILGISADAIDPDRSFSDYGIDSILGVGFIDSVNLALELTLNTTVIFDHATARRLAAHAHGLGARTRSLAPVPATPEVPPSATGADSPAVTHAGPVGAASEAIAVIGMAGQFPGAAGTDQLWEVLLAGGEPVKPLPEHYLSPEEYADDKQPGKSYCRWGGILETRGWFDPLFFGLSPREAESMNPHQRLILQEGWHALEDAGIDPRSLAGSRTGIFVGCEPSAYVHETFTGASDAIVASRLSYLLDLKGPAFVVNTGCSSSGVALHQACESLRRGESELALAGGAFAVMGPGILIGLAQTDMLTHTGACHSFDAAADGMVMSEGVGMVVLKRLDQAIADGDPIYGVIRASGLNQDGASNGITAPSGSAQQELIVEVYRKFGIDPERIGYVEAHGTGTRLGDPVEANALTAAFRHYTRRTGFCALGSSKSRIGHTSAAAGVTGLITILLALRHGRIPPLHGFKTLNPLIDLAHSAFYPATGVIPWPAGQGRPRMAALNSFGHSGTNVHLVVEAYEAESSTPLQPVGSAGPELILLSARDEERLVEAGERLATYLARALATGAPPADLTLANLAHTLQVGRTALEERLAFVASDLAEVRDTLESWLRDTTLETRLHRGRLDPRRRAASDPLPVPLVRDLPTLDAMARAWVGGTVYDWASQLREFPARRIHLPGYPFAREHYWKPQPARSQGGNGGSGLPEIPSGTFDPRRPLFRDHVIGGRSIIPGAFFLHWGVDGVARATRSETSMHPLCLDRIVWVRPVVLGEAETRFHTTLERLHDGGLAYGIRTTDAEGRDILHHQARIATEVPPQPPRIALDALCASLTEIPTAAEQCYRAFAQAGTWHGPSLQVIQQAFGAAGQLLVLLQAQTAESAATGSASIDAALLDGAFQASSLLQPPTRSRAAAATLQPASPPVPRLPFSLERVAVYAPTVPRLWAWIRFSDPDHAETALPLIDIDLLSLEGDCLLRLEGLHSRPAPPAENPAEEEEVIPFSGREYVLTEHSGILPVAVYLSLLLSRAAPDEPIELAHVIWPSPWFHGREGSALLLRKAVLDGREQRVFHARSDAAGGAGSVHCQADIIRTRTPGEPPRIDLQELRAGIGRWLDRRTCAEYLKNTHGPALLSVAELGLGDGMTLARLVLPAVPAAEARSATPHSSLLNSAVLAAVIQARARNPGLSLPMPFSLERLRVWAPLGDEVWAVVRESRAVAEAAGIPGGYAEYDIELHSAEGRCLLAFERLRLVFNPPGATLLAAVPAWYDQPPPATARPSAVSAPLFLLAPGAAALATAIGERWPRADIVEWECAPTAPDPATCLARLLGRVKDWLSGRPAGPGAIIALLPVDDEPGYGTALGGLLKSIAFERTDIATRVLHYEWPDAGNYDPLLHCVATELGTPEPALEVHYLPGQVRQARRLGEFTLPESPARALDFGPGAIVLITGGLGGIGRGLAEYLGIRGRCYPILCGRSAPGPREWAFIEHLRTEGNGADYVQADVTSRGDMARLFDRIAERHGRLDVIIHTAGVNADGYLKDLAHDDIDRVLAPKVTGTLLLDEFSARFAPAHFILCASIAGALGNPGQSHYALANAFQDAFAHHRNARLRRDHQSGATWSIDWPLWQDGGMRMPAANQELMRAATGMTAMPTHVAIEALARVLAGGQPQVLVAYGEAERMRTGWLGLDSTVSAERRETAPDGEPAGAEDDLLGPLHAALRGIVAELQRIPLPKVRLHTPLSDYGFDSISFTELANQLNRSYRFVIMPTVFFEIPDLASLGEYLLQHHRSSVEARHRPQRPTAALAAPAVAVSLPPQPKAAPSRKAEHRPAPEADAIAIIGFAARLPGCRDLDEFWEGLVAGRDFITEVPAVRWDWRAIHGDPHAEPGKTRVKWGGFIHDADAFDERFFGISPLEAETLDPQLRVFLETVWAAIEDAGYPASALSGSRTGVFAGVATADYKELLVEAKRQGQLDYPAEPFPFMTANRVSYWFNFRGPSEVIDTACSSSLIAVHRAVESLRNGHCDLALAGGVNIMASPRLTIASSQAGLLSESGRCMTFDQRANGYVRSEGVGVILLKPLRRAVEDGDFIHGIIRGSGENHGGRAASPTAPNTDAQRALLLDVYRRSGIPPESVGYIEAHGTGTALGDPIEVNALKAAFAELLPGTAAGRLCGLGSVKANIGHLEAAAGVTGIIKVLLMFRHGIVPGNPHLDTPNPFLKLEDSPFFLADQTRDWPRGTRPDGRFAPYRAGVSSFGVGGSNAHVILEAPPALSRPATGQSVPVPIVLSARDSAALKRLAAELARYVEGPGRDCRLEDIAHTLQVGREALACRCGFVAGTLHELSERLREIAAAEGPVAGVQSGDLNDRAETGDDLGQDDDLAHTFRAWLAKGRYDRLLAAWVSGLLSDWRVLPAAPEARRIPLPPYPFERRRHWVPVVPTAPATPAAPATPPTAPDPAAAVQWLREDWRPAPAPERRTQVPARVLCVLDRPGSRRLLVESLAEFAPGLELEFVGVPRDELSQAALRDALAAGGGIAAIFHLGAVEDASILAEPGPLVRFLQALARTPVRIPRILLAAPYRSESERCHADAWVSLGDSLRPLLPGVSLNVVLEPGDPDTTAEVALRHWFKRLHAESGPHSPQSVWYQGGERRVRVLSPLPRPADPVAVIRQGGTYLITGGAGGLGGSLAVYLAERYRARLILVGRSAPERLDPRPMARLRDMHADLRYLQADVADEGGFRAALAGVQDWLSELRGVFHVAGLGGAPLPNATSVAAFEAVLKPKIEGTRVVERLFGAMPLDFICHFSSIAALVGDFGSCDYALANRFQTAFAKAAAERGYAGGGRSFVVNWPLLDGWARSVGDPEQTRFYLESTGQRLLAPDEALPMLEQILAGDELQVMVLTGGPEVLARLRGQGIPTSPEPRAEAEAGADAAPGAARPAILERLRAETLKLLKLEPEGFSPRRTFSQLGFDSIALAEFSRRLSRVFHTELKPSVFFNHPTPARLAEHLAGLAVTLETATQSPEPAPPARPPRRLAVVRAETSRAAPAQPATLTADPVPDADGIAIIGTSGRFPKARSVAELWQILEQGIDAVEEIPADRFDWRGIYAEPGAAREGRSISKWCGTIPGIAEFDSLFFEISPLEAERMDPRQRHLLQESWHALENAGYGAYQIERQRIGMFVGVEEGCDYTRRVQEVSLTAAHNGILAARLAYFLNLKGPVMALNTACSSALVALHQACQSLRLGECDAAIAAGVNLMVSPEAYIGMSQAGMLSPDGRCHTFDRRANGMVPGEAVAVVVLKRLSRALAEGDPIQAVIRASGVNYDGRTNGITAPNGAAQTELVRDVQRQGRVRPSDVGLVIAHGTATQLGDPVEVNALIEAFADPALPEPPRCGLVSIKSNLGHTFAASGLVSLIGLVESLRHRVIPPAIHFREANTFIDWQRGGFQVNPRRTDWQAAPGQTRIGAVSAFGMSGTNAHVIVAEAPVIASTGAPPETTRPEIIALSAKTREALREMEAELLAYLETAAAAATGLAAISATLLLGRHHFAFRKAVSAMSLAEAAERLARAPIQHVHPDFEAPPAAVAEANAVSAALSSRDPAAAGESPEVLQQRLIALFLAGTPIPWHQVIPTTIRRAVLPGTVFARDICWIEGPRSPAAEAVASPPPAVASRAGAACACASAPVAPRAVGPATAPVRHPAAGALSLVALVATEVKAAGPRLSLSRLIFGYSGLAPDIFETRPTLSIHPDAARTVFRAELTGTAATVTLFGQVDPVEERGDAPARSHPARLRAGLKPRPPRPDAFSDFMDAPGVRVETLYEGGDRRLAVIRALPEADGALWGERSSLAAAGLGLAVGLVSDWLAERMPHAAAPWVPYGLRRLTLEAGTGNDSLLVSITLHEILAARVTCDVTFTDPEGAILARFEGLKLTHDPGLARGPLRENPQ